MGGRNEASIHAARNFIKPCPSAGEPQVLLKFNVRNAFNSSDQNCIPEAAALHLPQYFPFILQCYGEVSYQLCGEQIIHSQSGVQQGDPQGPLLHCLATAAAHVNLVSPLAESYLDEDLLAGPPALF